MFNVNISAIAIITIKKVVSHCIFHNISKSEATNLLNNYFLKAADVNKTL